MKRGGPGASPGGWPDEDRASLRGPRGRRLALGVLVFGFLVTGVLSVVARHSYDSEEQRITRLQSTLVADAIGSAPVDVERRLGVALAAAAGARNPAAVFASRVASSMAAAKGPFSAAGLALVQGDRARSLLHLGSAPLRSTSSPAATAFYLRVARTPGLVTTHPTVGRRQRLAYGIAEATARGTYVAYASQVLPANRRFSVAPSNPESDFYLALYFGRTATASQLLLTNAPSVPITGAVSVAHVPFGSAELTIVSAPRVAIAGTLPEVLPWAILAIGVALALLVAGLVDRLVRREGLAASYASVVQELYDQQRGVAETLQHSLLPRELPEVAGLEFAARYVPGTRGLEVGGDWYDVVPIGATEVMVSVGDVSGKGLSAASLMATLRYAIRARASYGLSPAEILAQLSTLVDLARDGHFATISCAALDTTSGHAEIASAGHLPPIGLADGTAWLVDVPAGPPVGLGHSDYEEVKVDLAPGSTMLFYTDGLVERRDERLDVSLARLVELCQGTVPLEERLDLLLGELVGGGGGDDVAVLAVRRLQ